MKILVTGGAGYIGSTLVRMLLNDGHDVTVYDIFSWGLVPLLHLISNERLQLIKGDVKDRDHVARIISDKDAIIHLAAIVGYPACDLNPDAALHTNVVGTKNIAEAKKSNQVLIFASTGSCYGSVDGICTENTKLEPLSLYGRSKAEGEEFGRAVGGIILRLATLYGLSPRLRLDLLNNDLSYKALHSGNIDLFEGKFRRTFLHVKDAARAFIFTLDNAEAMFGQAYNVGNETLNLTKLQVAETIQSLVPGCSIDEISSKTDKDKRDYEVSYSKIHDLGYQHAVSIEDGIHEMVKVLSIISFEDRTKYMN